MACSLQSLLPLSMFAWNHCHLWSMITVLSSDLKLKHNSSSRSLLDKLIADQFITKIHDVSLLFRNEQIVTAILPIQMDPFQCLIIVFSQFILFPTFNWRQVFQILWPVFSSHAAWPPISFSLKSSSYRVQVSFTLVTIDLDTRDHVSGVSHL
jgi:hypothetical protein